MTSFKGESRQVSQPFYSDEEELGDDNAYQQYAQQQQQQQQRQQFQARSGHANQYQHGYDDEDGDDDQNNQGGEGEEEEDDAGEYSESDDGQREAGHYAAGSTGNQYYYQHGQQAHDDEEEDHDQDQEQAQNGEQEEDEDEDNDQYLQQQHVQQKNQRLQQKHQFHGQEDEDQEEEDDDEEYENHPQVINHRFQQQQQQQLQQQLQKQKAMYQLHEEEEDDEEEEQQYPVSNATTKPSQQAYQQATNNDKRPPASFSFERNTQINKQQALSSEDKENNRFSSKINRSDDFQNKSKVIPATQPAHSRRNDEEDDEEEEEQQQQLGKMYSNEKSTRPGQSAKSMTMQNELKSYEEQIAELKRKMQQQLDFTSGPTKKRLDVIDRGHRDASDDENDEDQEQLQGFNEDSQDGDPSERAGQDNFMQPKMQHLKHIPRPKSAYTPNTNMNLSSNPSSISYMQQSQLQSQAPKAPHPYLKKKPSQYLAPSASRTLNNNNSSRSIYQTNQSKEIGASVMYERPKTASQPFKPVYKVSMQEMKVIKKEFDYTNKKFKTLVKKSDPVSRYQSLQNTWKSNKFLANNSSTSSSNSGTLTKEGRKLNLSERISSTKPENMFYRYMTKNDIINQYV